MKNIFPRSRRSILSLICIITILSCDISNSVKFSKNDLSISVPVIGNSWVISDPSECQKIISNSGIRNWDNPKSVIRTYFKFTKSGNLNIALRVKVNSGQSKIKCSFNNSIKELTIKNRDYDTVAVGTFKANIGYQHLDLQGINKGSKEYADITDILIGGEATNEKVYFVKEDFYWGRRGPSVHLSYQTPKECKEVKWFYNEITVPEGNDVIGSYFMANGFGEGYFGIQVNSKKERRILFSVWSPFHTDNPNDIPENQRIKLLKKGDDVYTGKFGNEGSGGQSYRKYMWKAGTTYRFLLKGHPSVKGCTDYTAYFYAPEIGKWKIIASFRRPKTSTYLTRHHSFLENFLTEMGASTRMANYTNQWVCDSKGKWHELTNARFSADATARKESRMDYAGGVKDGKFFMKNCGFFNETVKIGRIFNRPATGNAPKIDFSKLP